MKFSNSIYYAMKSLVYMARNKHQVYMSNIDIANAMNIAPTYLSKVLKILAQKGLLSSKKGPGQGYSFCKMPEKIFLMDIVEAFNERDRIEHCFFGWEACHKISPCPLHNIFSDFKKIIEKNLTTKTIQDISTYGWKDEKLFSISDK